MGSGGSTTRAGSATQARVTVIPLKRLQQPPGSLDSLHCSRSLPVESRRQQTAEQASSSVSMDSSELKLIKELQEPQAERSRADVLLEHPMRERFRDSNGERLRCALENVSPEFRRRVQRPGGVAKAGKCVRRPSKRDDAHARSVRSRVICRTDE